MADWVKKYGLLFALAASLAFLVLRQPKRTDTEGLRNQLEAHLHELQAEVSSVHQSLDNDTASFDQLPESWAGIPLSWYVSLRGRLVYWNNIETPFRDYDFGLPDTTSILKLKSGWFLLIRKTMRNSYQYNALIPFKYNYPFENRLLRNRWVVDHTFPADLEISLLNKPQALAVKNKSGGTLFYVFKTSGNQHIEPDIPAIVSELLVLILLLSLLVFGLRSLAKPGLRFFLLLLIVMVIRGIGIIWHLPVELYRTDLFNPRFYASGILNQSLGDLLLNSAMVFWLFYEFFRLPIGIANSLSKIRFRMWVSSMLILLFAMSGLLVFVFKSLVFDSIISFEIYNILSLDYFSLPGIFALALLQASHFLLARKLFDTLFTDTTHYKYIYVFASLILLGFSLIGFYSEDSALFLFATVWTVAYIFIFIIFYKKAKTNSDNGLRFLLMILSAYSLLSAFLIESLYEKKEKDQRLFYANKLSAERDYIAEYSFADILQRLQEDPYVKSFFTNPDISRRDLQARINYVYLSGYFAKYDLQFYAYNQEGNPLKSPDAAELKSFIQEMHSGLPVMPDSLLTYAADTLLNYCYYSLAVLNLDSGKQGLLGITLRPKSYSSENVFPELLIGDNLKSQLDNSLYNYAIYFNSRLLRQKGDYPYPLQWKGDFSSADLSYKFIESQGWEHLLMPVGANRMVVVSLPSGSLFEPVATFSYLLTLYSLFVFSFILFYRLLFHSSSEVRPILMPSFRLRINLAMMFVIILSFVIIGIITLTYLRGQYTSQYRDRLLRKEKSILANLEYYIRSENADIPFGSANDLLTPEVGRLAELYGVEVNIYDTLGHLMVTSQPLISDKGLQAGLMNYEAWRQLRQNEFPQITAAEKIGELNYLTTYAALRDRGGAQIGFLGVPYLEQEKNIEAEISGFLVALLNVYVFLLICAAVIAFFVANSITRPLSLVAENLRFITLNRKNEPISYSGKDEIGLLISEYNKMIAELEQSAQMLARNERETAWREMARQVAHEIKNPLTPMRLSIQHLQRAIDEGNPNTEAMIKRIGTSLIEQIDHLARIATAFSSFAQMPRPENELINLHDLLSSVIDVFGREVEICWHRPEKDIHVFADRNQLLSVFNNLIKNAIQSIPESRQAEISVSAELKEDLVNITVRDNGVGIPEEFYDKIFVPNFTTKSSGSGLGLAISMQIVKNAGGSMRFSSVIGQGASFVVSLPLYDPTDHARPS